MEIIRNRFMQQVLNRAAQASLILALLGLPAAQAGVFNIPKFVEPGRFAVGIEPEVIFTHGAGVGVNGKFVFGLSTSTNATAIVGTGAGPEEFRVGGNLTFDIFPDVDKQPGIGLALQGVYYDQDEGLAGVFKLSGVPYIHKAFESEGAEFDPFLAIPVGLKFSDGRYQAHTSVAVGSFFKGSEHIQYVVEVGVGINNAETYLSGGVIYFHF